MQRSFWNERWSEGRIGFHQERPHPALDRHWAELKRWLGARAERPSNVLVPLCGKSLDLDWLARRESQVVGVEFVESAARTFFDERGVAATREPGPPPALSHGNTRIIVGDFFALEGSATGRLDLAYDRAALVAIPPERRVEYVVQLWRLLAPNGGVLLISFEHDMGTGPPFSIDEGASLFEQAGARGAAFRSELVERKDILQEEPRFRERGATFIRELVWFLEKRAQR